MIVALDKKCPKLRECKSNGAISVLVLEEHDIALTNHRSVGEAVQAAIADRTDVPDEIFLVSTAIEQEWTVWSLLRDGTFWPDEDTDRRYREFAASILEEV
jgi:hypothetical protein